MVKKTQKQGQMLWMEYVDFCDVCLLVFGLSHNSKGQWNWSGKHSNP